MTKPPAGGSASAPSTSEFGATTISGTASTDRDGADRSGTGRVGSLDERDSGSPRPAGHRADEAARDAAPAKATTVAGVRSRDRNRGPRRARLQLRHIDPLTVLKFSCVLAIALFFVWLIVIGVLYGILDAGGIIDHINEAVTTINGAGSKAPVTAGIVFGGAAIVGVVNIVLFIALTTIGAVIYNLCADLVGGIEITLSER